MDIGTIGLAACLGFAALGSALGIGTAGQAAIGAWKKCFVQNKPAPFTLIAFAGAPLTQTIYGLILMNIMRTGGLDGAGKLGVGIFAGLAMGMSAFYQGKCGAAASDSYAETGQGFANDLLVVGLVEVVALFVMVFFMMIAG